MDQGVDAVFAIKPAAWRKVLAGEQSREERNSARKANANGTHQTTRLSA